MCTCAEFLYGLYFWRIADYLVIIVLAIIAAVLGHFVRPHCREFSWTDASIQHPHRPDTFPMYSVAVAVVVVALISYFPGELCTRWSRAAGKVSMGLHLNGWVLTHAYSILLAFAVVNLSKLYAGRLRPDFIARLALENITEANFGDYSHADICDAAREGRLSFPSGHAGTIFSGFVPTSLYLLGLMRTFKHGTYWRAFIAFIPMILPIAVAVSRTLDYRHNFDDIVAGAFIGTFCAVFAVLLSFRTSRTGEWTLRAAPVHTLRNKGDPEPVARDEIRDRERHAAATSPERATSDKWERARPPRESSLSVDEMIDRSGRASARRHRESVPDSSTGVHVTEYPRE